MDILEISTMVNDPEPDDYYMDSEEELNFG